jgi:hypothetical protein
MDNGGLGIVWSKVSLLHRAGKADAPLTFSALMYNKYFDDFLICLNVVWSKNGFLDL